MLPVRIEHVSPQVVELEYKNPFDGSPMIIHQPAYPVPSLEEVNLKLEIINRKDKHPIKVRCVTASDNWQYEVQEFIKSHVESDLPLDSRPDLLWNRPLMPETLRELSGVLSVTSQGINELFYNNTPYPYSLNGEKELCHSTINCQIDDDFQRGDKLVFYHTHPLSRVVGETDVRGYKDICLLPKTLRAKYIYHVIHIPKIDTSYWLSAKKASLLNRGLSRLERKLR